MYFGCICIFFFFFSSRRRHTRCSRDWSSDVCSSDLVALSSRPPPSAGAVGMKAPPAARGILGERGRQQSAFERLGLGAHGPPHDERSEERRVGKERRAQVAREPGRGKQARSADG